MKKKLVTIKKDGLIAKDIMMFDDPRKMKPILNDIRWEILKKLSKKPCFPAELAREMHLHEQKVYYHIKHFGH